MTFGSVFSGIGAMDLGLEWAGWRPRWHIEIDRDCRRVLAARWPGVPQHADIHAVTGDELERVDAIVGGPPCQPASCAGKRLGTADPRWLWPEMHRLVSRLRPLFLVVENVPAVRTRGADQILGDLEATGYTCWPVVVGARHVGAPHRRDRIFIIARLADACESRLSERLELPGRAGEESTVSPGRGVSRGSYVADAVGGELREQPGRRGGAGG